MALVLVGFMSLILKLLPICKECSFSSFAMLVRINWISKFVKLLGTNATFLLTRKAELRMLEYQWID